MSNIEITNNATNGFVVSEPKFNDAIFTAAGADTFKEGTLLGRVAADGKMAVYSGVTNVPVGTDVAVAILRNELVTAGAGDTPIRPLISGTVKRRELYVHGLNKGVITNAEEDMLRDFTIVTMGTEQLTSQDNQ